LRDLVTYDSSGQPEAIHYPFLPLYLIELAKEQDARIRELSHENATLQARVKKIEEKLNLSNDVCDGNVP